MVIAKNSNIDSKKKMALLKEIDKQNRARMEKHLAEHGFPK